ncbi:MAG: bestrophin family ion channel [Myxococcota bacterium]
MYVRRNIRWSLVWRFAWKHILVFSAYGSAVVGGYVFAQTRGIDISLPYAPLGTIGVAVAFYIGFKNNQAYDRFWEARKIWGGVVNESRTWANRVLTLPVASDERANELRSMQHRLVYRHVAWINSLRLQLRKTTILDRSQQTSYVPDLHIDLDRDRCDGLREFLTDEDKERLDGVANKATHLVRFQGEGVQRLRQSGFVDAFQEQLLHEPLRELYNLQGKCERIKNTPLPRQFAYFSSVFVRLFALLLPFGLLGLLRDWNSEWVWLAVPLSVTISWMFNTIEVVGDNSEDPFENYVNDVPMTALCRTIEIDLRQMLGEREVPESIRPVADILL